MKAGIIGFGETGTEIALLCLQQEEMESVLILDPNPKKRGKFMDLSHAASCRSIELLWNDQEAVKEIDVFFYCAGYRNTRNTDRATKAGANKKLIKTIFQPLELKKEASVIVISNPVESMSRWIFEHLKNKHLVVGTGTELDTQRLKTIVAERLQTKTSDVEIKVIGEHGKYMTPLFDEGTILDKPFTHYFDEKELEELKDELINTAHEIRKTEKATKYGVAQCAIGIMNSLFSHKSKEHILSTTIPKILKEKTGIQQDIFISLPVKIYSGEVKILENFKISHEEFRWFSYGAQKIEKTDYKND